MVVLVSHLRQDSTWIQDLRAGKSVRKKALTFSSLIQDITIVGYKSRRYKQLSPCECWLSVEMKGLNSSTLSQRESLHVTPPVPCSGGTGHLLQLWPGGASCGAKAAIPCVDPGSKCISGWASLISGSHASDWFVLVTDSCDNEVIVRRQSVHRNVFMSYGLGSWGFCGLRGSSWLGQSKGQNMEWLYKRNPCCFLICIRC